jgi:SAM-dependent methyltransferase
LRIKSAEIAHNLRISKKAEVFWGWATPAGKARVQRRIRLISRLAELKKGLRVLELGCGTGTFTQYFAQTGISLFAIDLSADFISRARAKMSEMPNALCVCDAESLCFQENSFDVVLGVSILHHLSLNPVLSEIKRVLRDGGTLVFTEPNMLNPQILAQKNISVLKRWAGDSPDEGAFLRWRIQKLLQEGGFCDVRVEPFDFVHPFVPAFAVGLAERTGAVFERLPLIREFAGSLLIRATFRSR